MRLKYRPHIDGLRAVAVLAVIGYHAFPGAVPGGFIGVDIFFVISGFLISSILYREFAAPGSSGPRVIMGFYGRRIRRIFPALIVVLIACYFLGFQTLLPVDLKKLSLHIAASAGFCLNFFLAGETGYFNSEAAANPLLHLWSLGVEEQFYLLWPLVIWLAARCRIRFLPTAIFLAVFSYCWNAHKPDDTPAVAAAFFLPQMRLWELLIGSIAAAIFPLLPARRHQDEADSLPLGGRSGRMGAFVANALPAAGLVLIGLGLWFMTNKMELPNAWTLLPTVGTACVICSDGSAWINRRFLSLRGLVWIGLISYPLYLWHWPLLSFSQIALDNPDSPGLKAAAILGSVALAWLTYRLVENPLRHGGHSRQKIAWLVGVMVPVGAVGYLTYHADGFSSRFPPLIQQLSNFNYDASAWKRTGYYLADGEDEHDFRRDTSPAARAKPTLYLWGDSHAAALYPGMEQSFGAKYAIVQRSSANLAPFVTDPVSSSTHARINRYILEAIKREQPACVVLAGNWPQYQWKNVGDTIAALHAAGIRHIVLVGPVPHWKISLPQQLCNYARHHQHEPVPLRLKTGLTPEPPLIDADMSALAGQWGVEYISPCHILGNADGFLVRTGDNADSLVAYDYGHLTAAGSRYLVAHFPQF